MPATLSGETVGNTIANLQMLWYNRFWTSGRTIWDVLAELHQPAAGLTLDLLLGPFRIEMVKPILEEGFSN